MPRQRLVLGGLLQALQRAHDRHAGLEQRVHLAAEQQNVDMPDLLLAQALEQARTDLPPARPTA